MRHIVLSLGIIVAGLTGCGGDHEHGEHEEDAGPPPTLHVDESMPPPDLIVRTDRPNNGGSKDDNPSGRDVECIEPDELCDGRQNDCRPDHPDAPGEFSIGDSFGWISERAKEATAAFGSAIDGIVNGFGTKGVDLTAYNSVPGYRIKFECELEDGSHDFSQGGFAYSTMGLHQCDLRANAVSSRRVRMIVERESDGHRVWQNRILISPSLGKTLGTEKIGEGNSGTAIQIPLEGGAYTLHAAFYSTGWTKVGAAGNRNQGALYLTPDRRRWMEKMSDEKETPPDEYGETKKIPDKNEQPLSTWVLPGSHDAGMYSYGSFDLGTNGSMTQSETIGGQLEVGMRYFDLRIAASNACLIATISKLNRDEGLYCGWAAHGPSSGASYASMIDDVLDFTTKADSKEIVVLHFTGPSGFKAPGDIRFPSEYAAYWVNVMAKKRGLGADFVKVVDGNDKEKKELSAAFALSPKALLGKGTHIIAVYDGNTANSWNEDDYQNLVIAPNLVHIATGCLTAPGADRYFVGSSLQLQGTGTAKSLLSQSLQGNKLVFDRQFYPWVARGNVEGCVFGPTFVINDFVDNAFTDSVIRGAKRGPRKPREQFDVDDQADDVVLPDAIEWLRGDLTWHARPVVVATKNHVLTLQDDGNVVIYRTARDAKKKVCNRDPIWSTNTAGKGERFDFQSDGVLVVYGPNRALWSSERTYRRAVKMIFKDGNLTIVDEHGKMLWSSNSGNKPALACK